MAGMITIGGVGTVAATVDVAPVVGEAGMGLSVARAICVAVAEGITLGSAVAVAGWIVALGAAVTCTRAVAVRCTSGVCLLAEPAPGRRSGSPQLASSKQTRANVKG